AISDVYTEFLQKAADQWRPVTGLSNPDVLEQIKADKIDILIDLAGHTSRNRLQVFAMKPAPVQVTWLGYPNTTGLKAMDYRVVDAISDPIGDDPALCSETLVRLPGGFLCYEAAPKTPPVGPLPALAAGHIAFGSFNKINKISDTTVRLWSRVLQAVPSSR